MNYFILIAAILPAIVLLWHIYRKDKYQPEPTGELIKGFGWGILSALLAIALAAPLSSARYEEGTFVSCVYNAFCCAAIPEEIAKALCLCLFLRKNKYFDEYMDGIVYAVAVGMGFAGFENILYLFDAEDWITIGIVRALLSVPGHFAFAVLMGYHYSLWRIRKDNRSLFLMLLAPILAHGIFDFLLFYMEITEAFASIILVAFVWFLHKLRKHYKTLIEEHLANDIKEQQYYNIPAQNNE